MPVEQAAVPIPGTEYVWDQYQPSLRMSTYLLAFIVSDFVYRESEVGENGVKFRIWSREDAVIQTEYASVIGPQILRWLLYSALKLCRVYLALRYTLHCKLYLATTSGTSILRFRCPSRT